MDCSGCPNKISPRTAPFGGFCCSNDHLQCYLCNQRCHGICVLCFTSTSFLKMDFCDTISQDDASMAFSDWGRASTRSSVGEIDSCSTADFGSISLSENSSKASTGRFVNDNNCCKTRVCEVQETRIVCQTLNDTQLLLAKMLGAVPKACHAIILRSPLECPETHCTSWTFVSDFNKHMAIDHPTLPRVQIWPRQYKKFFLDPRKSCVGLNTSNLLFLLGGKISDLGSSEYMDFLPVVLMSTRVPIKLCDSADDDDSTFLMIWLTGIVPEGRPMYASLTMRLQSEQDPIFGMGHSVEIYSIRESQAAMDVFRSGQRILLSEKDLELLTPQGKNTLELQLVVH